MTISTEAIAVYGAVTGTLSMIIALVALVFQGIATIRDKKKIKVSYSTDNVLYGNMVAPYKVDTEYISIDVVNTGRRPAVILEVGAMMYTKNRMVCTDILREGRFTLQEGEKKTSLMEQELLDLSKVIYFYAKDSGKKHYKDYVQNWFTRTSKKILFGIGIFK